MTTPLATAPPITDPDRAVATLVTAFAADPVIRWILPEPDRYLAAFPALVRLLGGDAFTAGTADVDADHAGAALWVSPDAETDDEALTALLEATVAPERHPQAFDLLEQVVANHPADPVWYLPFIGVDPTRHGRGIGGGLLRRGLARADHDGLPAYLEATTPRNRALYERHGFTVVAEIRAGDSPPLWPMLRPGGGPVR